MFIVITFKIMLKTNGKFIAEGKEFDSFDELISNLFEEVTQETIPNS